MIINWPEWNQIDKFFFTFFFDLVSFEVKEKKKSFEIFNNAIDFKSESLICFLKSPDRIGGN